MPAQPRSPLRKPGPRHAPSKERRSRGASSAQAGRDPPAISFGYHSTRQTPAGPKRGLDICRLDDLGRGQSLYGLQPPQVGQRHDRRLLTSETDHLVRLAWIRFWLRSHASHPNATRRRKAVDDAVRPGTS